MSALNSSAHPSSSAMAPPANVSYTGLPLELREQILTYCTPKALAHLSVTSKEITSEAETMLYETVSLHLSCESQLTACLRTLCDPGSSKKARLIQTFAVTFNHSESAQFAEKIFVQLRIGLRLMTSLQVLSVWAPEPLDVTWMGIRAILERRVFTLRRLYISGLNDLPQLLQSLPCLEVIGLWSTYTHRGTWPMKIQWQLARHLFTGSSGLTNRTQWSLSPSAPKGTQRPVVFEIEHDLHNHRGATVRTLTIYDYPLEAGSAMLASNVDEQPLGEGANTHFLAFYGRNVEAQRQLYEDLKLDFSRDEEWRMNSLLQLTVRDLSPLSLRRARELSLPILQSFPYRSGIFCIRKPFVSLLVVDPPTPENLNMTHIREPLQQLLKTCLNQNVNWFGLMNYSGTASPEIGRTVSEQESADMVGSFADAADEVIRDAGPGGFERRFDLHIFEEEVVYLNDDDD